MIAPTFWRTPRITIAEPSRISVPGSGNRCDRRRGHAEGHDVVVVVVIIGRKAQRDVLDAQEVLRHLIRPPEQRCRPGLSHEFDL